MKRILLLSFTLLAVLALAACGGNAAEQPAAAPAEAPVEAPAEAPADAAPAAPAEAPAEAGQPETTPVPDTPYFIVSFEDGTPVPDRIEGKAGEDNLLKLFFALENGDGMIGWDRDVLEAAGVHSDMSFEFIDTKGLLVTLWSEGAAECAIRFFINGSGDWENPEVLYEKEFTIVFAA